MVPVLPALRSQLIHNDVTLDNLLLDELPDGIPVLATTATANAQANGLRGRARVAYERFLDELAHSGCAALGYRVTGPEPLPRLCVKHLRGADRNSSHAKERG